MDEMCSAHFGLGKDGKPWTESVVVVKPGATDAEIETAADTAKKLAAQFADEVEQAKQDSESLSARFILERFAPKEILEHMDADFAGSCRMPIGKFGDTQLPETVAEVYEECPKAVQWAGITKALELMEDASADKIIGVVACGAYWDAMGHVKTGKPVVKPKEEDLERQEEDPGPSLEDEMEPAPIDSDDWI